jgi:rare lipoprotein A (peptidoglycan hydrolase)
VIREPADQLFALAGVALLAAVIAVAVTGWGTAGRRTSAHPVGDFVALAGSAGPAAFGHRTACGGVLRADTLGIAHPTLPCGARIFINFHGKHVLTQVVDRGPYVAGRQFDVTDALARLLGLVGVQRVHWSYAQAS